MAIKGRIKYSIYLDANDVELIKTLFDAAEYKPGLSGFYNDYTKKFADLIRAADKNNEIDTMIDYFREKE